MSGDTQGEKPKRPSMSSNVSGDNMENRVEVSSVPVSNKATTSSIVTPALKQRLQQHRRTWKTSSSSLPCQNQQDCASSKDANTMRPPPRDPTHPLQQRSRLDSAVSEVQVSEALTYVDDIKSVFWNRPQVYRQFLDLMKTFSGQDQDTPRLIARVNVLFRGQGSLIQGFQAFLEGGYEIGLADAEIKETERRAKERQEINRCIIERQEISRESTRQLECSESFDSGTLYQPEIAPPNVDLPSCPFCASDYDTELLLLSNQANKLPVSCRKCSYTFCFTCLLREQQRQSDKTSGTVGMWLECPYCKNSRGFSMENPSQSVHRPFCDLLAQCQRLSRHNETIVMSGIKVFDLTAIDAVTRVKDALSLGHGSLSPQSSSLGEEFHCSRECDTSSNIEDVPTRVDLSSPLSFHWLSSS